MSVYEVHLGSWRRKTDEGDRWLTYRELADELIPYVKQMGYTHLELMPIMEHPFDASWGYQTVGYYAVTSRFGTPADFMYFVDRCHQEGLGVILDWTPAHFPRDAHGLAFFDGTHLYEHEDPRKGEHPDWGTLVFNYGRNEVQNFLLSNALFWIDKYHIDGLRVDAVASMLYLDYSRAPGEWIPNEFGGRENLEAIAFIKRLNEVLHVRHPGALTIAEESTSWPAVSRPTYIGGLGFDLKWNMGWMNDVLTYFTLDPIHRQYPARRADVLHALRLPREFRPAALARRSGPRKTLPARKNARRRLAKIRQPAAALRLHVRAPGQEASFHGQRTRPAQRILGSELRRLGARGFAVAQGHSAPGRRPESPARPANARLHEVDFEWSGFEWMEVNDAASSVLSFLRRARNGEDFVVAVCNFTPVVRENYRIGVPRPGFYREILNTDSTYYEGTDIGNSGGVRAEPFPWNDRPYSIKLKLPPLAVTLFKLQRD